MERTITAYARAALTGILASDKEILSSVAVESAWEIAWKMQEVEDEIFKGEKDAEITRIKESIVKNATGHRISVSKLALQAGAGARDANFVRAFAELRDEDKLKLVAKAGNIDLYSV